MFTPGRGLDMISLFRCKKRHILLRNCFARGSCRNGHFSQAQFANRAWVKRAFFHLSIKAFSSSFSNSKLVSILENPIADFPAPIAGWRFHILERASLLSRTLAFFRVRRKIKRMTKRPNNREMMFPSASKFFCFQSPDI